MRMHNILIIHEATAIRKVISAYIVSKLEENHAYSP